MGLTSNKVQFLHMRFVDLFTKHKLEDELNPEQVKKLTADLTIRKNRDDLDIRTVNQVLQMILGEMALVAKIYETIYKSIAHNEDN